MVAGAAVMPLELALCFHHAVRGTDDHATVFTGRLHELTRNGDYAYYTDIAHFMAGQPLPHPSPARWLDSPETVGDLWRTLVLTRREHLNTSRGIPTDTRFPQLTAGRLRQGSAA